jgi:hypothetical protein
MCLSLSLVIRRTWTHCFFCSSCARNVEKGFKSTAAAAVVLIEFAAYEIWLIREIFAADKIDPSANMRLESHPEEKSHIVG